MGWGLRRGGKWRAGWMIAGLLCAGLCGLNPALAMMNSVPGDPTDRFAPEETADLFETSGIPESSEPPQGHTWQAARQLALNGDYEKAAALYASAYGQDPNPMLYRQYLEVLLKLERYKEAEALVSRQMRSVAKGGGVDRRVGGMAPDGAGRLVAESGVGGNGREAEDKVRGAGGRTAGGHLPQTLARYRVDLGQIHLAQGQASKAHKAFMQAVTDYWAQGGVGIGLDELSEALWTQSGTARYSAALYEEGRRAQPAASAGWTGKAVATAPSGVSTVPVGGAVLAGRTVSTGGAVSIKPGTFADEAAGCVPFAYELFKAYLHLGEMERMLDEALLFVRTQRDGCGGRETVATTAPASPYGGSSTPESRHETAMTQVEADWQAYFYGAREAASRTPAVREAQPAVDATQPATQPAPRASVREAQPAAQPASPAFRLKKALYTCWQKNPQNYDLAEWLRWAALQEGDYALAFRMAEVFKNFAYDGGLKLLETARTAIGNQAEQEAVAALENLLRQAAGQPQDYLPEVVRDARRELLDLQFRRLEQGSLTDSLELHRLKADYEALWRQNPQASAEAAMWPVARNLARLYAYHTQEEAAAQALMEQCIAQARVTARQRAGMKTEYADMLLFMGKTWDAMLLYAQVEKDFKQDAVGFYAKLQTARLSYYVGEFEWALSQLEVLRAATSKLIANDAMELSLLIKENNNADSTYRGLRYVARADALAYRRLYGQALQVLDSVLRMPAERQLHDDVYYKKARIYKQVDSLQEALAALEHVYRQPAGQPASLWADDALLEAAVLHEALGQPEKAMEACRELFERFPSSLLAPQTMEAYRRLRQAVGLSPQISGASSAYPAARPAACPETSEKSRKNKNS